MNEARPGVERRVVTHLHSPSLDGSVPTALTTAGYTVIRADPTSDVTACVDEGDPVVILLDDHGTDWLHRVSDLVRVRPCVRPVLVADLGGADECLAAIAAGVVGFCRSSASSVAIVRTVEAVSSTGVAIPREYIGALVAHIRHTHGRNVRTPNGLINLTEREWETLNLMLQRRSTREMAEALFVSVGTVRSHISSLLHKVGAGDRDEAIALIERCWNDEAATPHHPPR